MLMLILLIFLLLFLVYYVWVCLVVQVLFWLLLLLMVYFVLQGLVLWLLYQLVLWCLVESEVQQQQLYSLVWLLVYLVVVLMVVVLLCLVLIVFSWGLLCECCWGLWSFVVLLLLSVLINFVVVWWLDLFMGDFILLLVDDLVLLQELQLKCWLIMLIVVGMLFVFFGLQGWLVWCLLCFDLCVCFC